jgi:sugar (pentulose or hexulose) kinase
MTDTDLLLGIDIGTQGVKCIAINPKGMVVASHYIENICIFPGLDRVEADMRQNWWLNPIQAIREVLKNPNVKSEAIKGIGICGLYPAFGPTDDKGNPLAHAILYSDNRSYKEVYEVNQKQKLQLSSEELTPKLIWFLRHEPELAKQMAMFFDSMHYLVYKLTGAYIQDTQTTGLWGAIYESPTASWREDVCEKFGIPINVLPKVYPPATIIGGVHASAAEDIGLKVGTPVIAGLPDLSASLISVGTVYEDESCAYYGSAGLVPVLKDNLLNGVLKPYPISEKGLTAQDGYIYDYPAYCLSVGDAVRWFRDQFGQSELIKEESDPSGKSAYWHLDQHAKLVSAGSNGLMLLPYFQGQRSPCFDPYASGVYFGTTEAQTRNHFYRAILESFGYMLRHGLEDFYPNGQPIKRLVATGGGAKSPLWRQIVSDITGLSQEYVPKAEGAIGAAYVAGIALGWYTDFEPLRKEWVVVEDVTQPNPKSKEIYDQYFLVFRELHKALKPIFRLHHQTVENSEKEK